MRSHESLPGENDPPIPEADPDFIDMEQMAALARKMISSYHDSAPMFEMPQAEEEK